MKQALATLILMTTAAAAQNSPQVIRDDNYGVAYTVPAGWTATPWQLGHVLASPRHEGGLLVFVHTTKTMADAIRVNAEPFMFKNIINLMPMRPAEVISPNVLSVDLEGVWQGQQARARLLVLISPHGGAGLAVLAATHTADWRSEYVTLASTVARSAQFTKVDGTAAMNEWSARLAGKKLHYFTTYNGGSSGGMAGHKQLGLCSDGSFFFRGDFSASITVSGATGGTGSRNANIGRWKVETAGANAALRLVFSDGSQANYTLGANGTQTFLNGQRWLVENASECR